MDKKTQIKFQYNKKTGVLEAYKDGAKVGEVTTMGDTIQSRRNTGGKDGS